ncbi:MAG: DUF5668 domain-containing protein [Chloroflexi bacterium]|nr:DUF5668 domain-containing protein [Chloroflexota bacterium]MCI0580574.1 DUF5668 domain-containing protein [Chloroflexota bacterium]MCI0643546.1 DUF5668 domain-containing protein [Chloroflexota bacterium]MCI0727942.1 DUF5668 domain-containing protein [Chloroflexota bacterium]
MQRKSSIIGGLILIVVGAFFLALQMFPSLAEQLDIDRQWPLLVVAIGGLFLLGAFLGTPSLAVPGSVIAGIGSLLYYQNLTDNWESWSYAWTLILGFAGVGTFIRYTLQKQVATGIRRGGRQVLTSLILFVVFSAFMGGWLDIDLLWPSLLILLGLWLVIKNRLRGRD